MQKMHTTTSIKIKCWDDIFRSRIIERFFSHIILTGQEYLNPSSNHGISAIEEAEELSIYLSGSHYAQHVQNHLNETLPNR